MCKRVCPRCGSGDHMQGYGLAAGGIGDYIACLDCGEFLMVHQDGEAAPRVDTGRVPEEPPDA